MYTFAGETYREHSPRGDRVSSSSKTAPVLFILRAYMVLPLCQAPHKYQVFDFHCNPKNVLSSPFYRWDDWGTEKLSHLLKLIGGRTSTALWLPLKGANLPPKICLLFLGSLFILLIPSWDTGVIISCYKYSCSLLGRKSKKEQTWFTFSWRLLWGRGQELWNNYTNEYIITTHDNCYEKKTGSLKVYAKEPDLMTTRWSFLEKRH